jgi:hypothetical protein
MMLKECSRISIYKNNRMIGLFMMYGGIVTSVFALGGPGNGAPALLIGTGAGIGGAIISTVNKNKRKAKRVQIAKMYNGNFSEDR